jgi:hypothetical protein
VKKSLFAFTIVAVALFSSAARAELDAALKAKVDSAVAQAKVWAADPTLVSAVKTANSSPTEEMKGMTQDKWKGLPVLDTFVRSFTRNDAAAKLKSLKTDAVSEAFVSSADGKKVSFLNKPSNWSHAGKAKHDKPMAGETWIGEVEVDESTGQQQIQVAVPVLDGEKPIGSFVVGFSVSKL